MYDRYYILTLREGECESCTAEAAHANAQGGLQFNANMVLNGMSNRIRTNLLHDGCRCRLLPSYDGVPVVTEIDMESLRHGFLFYRSTIEMDEPTVTSIRSLYG